MGNNKLSKMIQINNIPWERDKSPQPGYLEENGLNLGHYLPL